MTWDSAIDLGHGGVVPSYVRRAYGEATLRTSSEVLGVVFDEQQRMWTVEEQGWLRCWSSAGRLQGRHYVSDLMTVWSFEGQGRWLAGGSDEVVIWQVDSGVVRARRSSGGWVTALGWDRLGRYVAWGREDGGVAVWEVASAAAARHWSTGSAAVAALAFSPDGRWLAVAGEDRHIRVYEWATQTLRQEWLAHPDRIAALTWHPHGQWLVSAGWDNSARLWQLDHNDPLILLNSHAEQVVALAYSPEGRYLACADSDGVIHLWRDPLRAELAGLLPASGDEVRCMAFSHDGRQLATGLADGTIVLWDVEQRRLLAGGRQQHRHRLAYVNTAGARLASVFAGRLQLWDLPSGAAVGPHHRGSAVSIAASPDGRWLAVGGADHCTHLYDLSTAGDPVVLEATKPPIGQIVCDAAGRRLAHTSPADGLVWIWDAARAQPELILIEAADGCTLEGLCFHPDGQRLAVGGLDHLATGQRTGAVVAWHLPSREQLYVIDVGVTALTVAPHGQWWAGAGTGGDVYLWNTTDGDELAVWSAAPTELIDLTVSPCAAYLVASAADQTIRVWTLPDGHPCVVRETDIPVDALLFAPDGQTLFAGLANGMVYAIAWNAFLDH